MLVTTFLGPKRRSAPFSKWSYCISSALLSFHTKLHGLQQVKPKCLNVFTCAGWGSLQLPGQVCICYSWALCFNTCTTQLFEEPVPFDASAAHGCCWETFYILAYCGLVVGIQPLHCCFFVFAPLPTSTKCKLCPSPAPAPRRKFRLLRRIGRDVRSRGVDAARVMQKWHWHVVEGPCPCESFAQSCRGVFL